MPGTPRLPLCGRGVGCAQPRSLGCARRAPQGAPRGALLMAAVGLAGSAVTGGGVAEAPCVTAPLLRGSDIRGNIHSETRRAVGDRMQETCNGSALDFPRFLSKEVGSPGRFAVTAACLFLVHATGTPMHGNEQHVLAPRPRASQRIQRTRGVLQRGSQVFRERRPPRPVTGSRFLPGEALKKTFSDLSKYEIIYQNLQFVKKLSRLPLFPQKFRSKFLHSVPGD